MVCNNEMILRFHDSSWFQILSDCNRTEKRYVYIVIGVGNRLLILNTCLSGNFKTYTCAILQEIVFFRVGGIDGIRNVYKPISFFQLKGWGLGVVEENHIQHQTFIYSLFSGSYINSRVFISTYKSVRMVYTEPHLVCTFWSSCIIKFINVSLAW